ncbi:MAG TPA: CAP domain-containing protein [Candidatus Dormibacteraeota bacterium]|jgi:tetratricopeptide (TPR) repeat protein|nr:CAP domain-containing protein [Candidatus Dormibacteraeota bacterium]
MRARAALVAACLVALAACTPTPPQARRATPAPSPSGPATLAEAVDALFANHYDAAERLFKSFLAAHPGSVEGHARYALLLNYEHRFDEAGLEADTAVRLGPRDALAGAVSTRVKDWSSDAHDTKALAIAVQRGAAAARLGPQLVMAHAFYAEALADYGLAAGDAASTASAAAQLDAATALASPDVYDRAEIERERANLAGDKKDQAGQLTHLQAARTIQPTWVERTREIADWYVRDGQIDKWQAEVARAVGLAPDDAELRISLGTVALEREDIALADTSFAAANRIRPHDAAVEAELATTGFCIRHDTAASEALLRAALADAPGSAPVGRLLQGFLRYVKGDPAGADAVTVGRAEDPARPGAKTSPTLDDLRAGDAALALAAVNAARAQAHLAPVVLDQRISSGAESHAYWFLFNLCRAEVKGLGIHHEVSGTPGFTGVTMRDRATHFGYPPASMAEDITHRGTPDGAVSDWVDSVFHRFPIMRPDLTAIGFGDALIGELPIEVMDMGYSTAGVDERSITPFPADGQTGVPTAFLGNELPDPVPAGGAYPTGYPVTVNFAPSARVLIADFRITDPGGAGLPLYSIQPTPAGSENVLSMLPRAPFKASTRYRVRITGTIDGGAFSLDYSFTTVPA